MNPTTGARKKKTYVRPMAGWWNRDPFFMRYMLREITAVAVFAYAVELMWGVIRLSQGEAAWNGWLAAVASPLGLLLNLVLLVSMVIHARSWFEIMPKTMPMMFIGGQRVPAATITRAGFAATAVATLVVLAIAWMARP
ncbi:MAG: fumarate reductase subunit C [Burkholderiales bacterium]|nr:fumarate reductase subunit C [Burkholderiales bacterium]